jgi:hypothetical protein
VIYPWELYAASFVQLLPVVGGLRYGASLPAPRRWFMLWCILSFVADGIQLMFSTFFGQNLWLRLIIAPAQFAVGFWALSLWQTESKPRTIMRQAIVILIPATFVIALLWEGTRSFGDKSGPILQLALLAACVYTLVSQDWFWITLGLSLYFALNVALGPVASALLSQNQAFLVQVFLFKARADILASILMTVGMLCPLPRNLSLKPT